MSDRFRGFRNARGEDGNILFLGLGVALVALLLIAGIAHVGALYLDKKRLAYVADGAALVYSDTATRNAYIGNFTDGEGNEGQERENQDPLTAARKYAVYVAGEYGLTRVSVAATEEGADLAIYATALASSMVGTADDSAPGRFVRLQEFATARNVTGIRQSAQ
ncbi:pilus assembly protein TadG-related protein [Populibacterium corticicola]|uniref:Pilus assembly protein TadG-related protein n=1 Tax=Populibacterium corticicola TaxID=1812826 RepID=A0ABW5XF54_9MICO